MGRIAWVGSGPAVLTLGVIGILLALLPTTPLILLAAFVLAKGLPRPR